MKRGRPLNDDAALVRKVRAARKRGLTVLQACDEIRRSAGAGPSGEQLERRYTRVVREYGPYQGADPKLRVMANAVGYLGRRSNASAAQLLMGRSLKKP